MDFEWDPVKAKNNLRKHGVSFEEAESVFYDLLAATVPDPDHSWDESRHLIVGLSAKNRLLIVSFADRIDNCRIISARELTKSERRGHEETE
ncbi:MAG: BrnT family toxin [Bryobacteraceae bacterium]